MLSAVDPSAATVHGFEGPNESADVVGPKQNTHKKSFRCQVQLKTL